MRNGSIFQVTRLKDMIPENEFLHLIDQNQNIIHKVCNIYCSNPADREDLYQEILLNAWKGFKHFRHESKFSTWLYRVALNTAITGLKKKQRHTSAELLSHEIAALPDINTGEDDLKAMRQAVEQLSAVEKAIVMLFFEDYSYQQIADIVGITANNVAVRMNRIRTKLKELAKKII